MKTTAGLLAGLLLAACQPAAGPAASAGPSAAAASAPAPAPAPSTTPAPAPARIDKQQLVGRFGVGGSDHRTVQFKANGRYLMLGGVVWDRIESTWSLEADGTRVRLHHDHQQPEDLLFGVRSADVLEILNADGTPSPGMQSTLERLPQ